MKICECVKILTVVRGTVELDTDVWLVDMFGDDAVGYDRDGEWWLVNVRTGKSTQISTVPARSVRGVGWKEESHRVIFIGTTTKYALAGDPVATSTR